MPENRFHELLGLPEEVSDPDYYQLLAVDRTVTDPAAIEVRFKEQMTRVQHIENPRHKEFLEFLKGELKRARSILTDAARRREYDQELVGEREEELRKILSHMLVDGKLSSVAEVSVISEGRNLGLDGNFIRKVVDEELQKAGAKRVSANGSAGETQIFQNKKAQEIARQVQEARLQTRLAQTRAHIAEIHQKKAEEQVQAVMQKARQAETHKKRAEEQVMLARDKAKQAEELARKAITREHVAAAKVQMSEQERKQLERRFAVSETRLQAFAEASSAELELIRGQGRRWTRLAVSYAALFVAGVAGDALWALLPGAAAALKGDIQGLLGRAGGSLTGVHLLAGVAVLVVPLHLLAARKKPFFAAPLILMVALALAAGLLRG